MEGRRWAGAERAERRGGAAVGARHPGGARRGVAGLELLRRSVSRPLLLPRLRHTPSARLLLTLGAHAPRLSPAASPHLTAGRVRGQVSGAAGVVFEHELAAAPLAAPLAAPGSQGPLPPPPPDPHAHRALQLSRSQHSTSPRCAPALLRVCARQQRGVSQQGLCVCGVWRLHCAERGGAGVRGGGQVNQQAVVTSAAISQQLARVTSLRQRPIAIRTDQPSFTHTDSADAILPHRPGEPADCASGDSRRGSGSVGSGHGRGSGS
eukprot:1052211-Rhodomonas_salina.1